MEENPKQEMVELRKSTLVLLFCLCGVLAVGTGVGIYRAYANQAEYGELAQLKATVEANYYTDVDEESAMQGAMKGYVAGLGDSYSQYMTDEEYGKFQINEAGQTVIIGVTVTSTEEGYLLVNDVTEDSPAEAAGLQSGDEIIAIDGDDVAELGYSAALEAVKGEENTSVRLTIRRDDTTMDCDVMRESVDVITAQGQMLDGNIGYIRISAFRENTPEQFLAVYEQLVSEGAKGLIFDLRDNSGGLVNSLEQILDPLLPEGEIAIATYRDGHTQTLVQSDAEECDLPMVVLVNENTASAAELFTASLRDFGKGEAVGTTTFGKGIMQVTQPMSSGGALTLTVATYQTTKGECYHGVGITPDVIVEAGDEPVDYDAPDAASDPQLAKALELVTE
ncbi:MAG: S41 family peptidase [Ruminococcus sp.]